jgi:uncharacterized protein involved in response to NO
VFAYGFAILLLPVSAALGTALAAAISCQLTIPCSSALDWHIHEMLYGYVAASIAGFLLTAIPNGQAGCR